MAYGIRERKAVTEEKPVFSVHLLIHLQLFSGNEDSFFKVENFVCNTKHIDST